MRGDAGHSGLHSIPLSSKLQAVPLQDHHVNRFWCGGALYLVFAEEQVNPVFLPAIVRRGGAGLGSAHRTGVSLKDHPKFGNN